MSKKSSPADLAEELPAASPPAAELAAPATVSGLALVDLPAAGLKCGQYASIPADLADVHVLSGEFDPHAPPPAD